VVVKEEITEVMERAPNLANQKRHSPAADRREDPLEPFHSDRGRAQRRLAALPAESAATIGVDISDVLSEENMLHGTWLVRAGALEGHHASRALQRP
jgi:hypothetical protein